MRISDWSSDVCSSDLLATKQPCSYRPGRAPVEIRLAEPSREHCQQEAEKETWQNLILHQESMKPPRIGLRLRHRQEAPPRSEEPTSELQSLMRISYAVFCLKNKKSLHPQQRLTNTN